MFATLALASGGSAPSRYVISLEMRPVTKHCWIGVIVLTLGGGLALDALNLAWLRPRQKTK
jgi:hypothetical protein